MIAEQTDKAASEASLSASTARFLFCTASADHRWSAHRLQELSRVDSDWEGLRYRSIQAMQ
jgi:hypothetical protein